MTGRTDERRNLLPLLLTFLLGLFIGWWVIGWWLWPVSYTNVLPQDLRPNEKGQYLTMVAESYAANGDLPLAQQRTQTWSREQLAQDITTAQGSVAAENPATASQLQRLSAALKLPAASGQPQGAAPNARPPQATAAPAQASNLLRQVCVGAVWVLVLLLGIAAVAWLWRQWQLRSGRRGTATTSPEVEMAEPLGSQPMGAAPADIAEREESRWEEVNDRAGGLTPDEDFLDSSSSPYAPPQTSTQPAMSTRPPAASDAAAAGAAAAATRSASPTNGDAGRPPVVPQPAPAFPIHVEEFLATYHAGEPDYDEAFDIKDESGAVVGQCGMSLMMPIGRGSDQAAALQVWLWEEKDQYTQVKVLMSDSAYKDTALRDQLADENPAVPIRQGTEFDLETHRLILHGTVEKIIYDEQDANRIFNYLAVRLQVAQT